ncbi:MAG TPA: Hsp33 family molecular chaperone HslO [Pelomicrobium sp.]|nr:Hsp33 family molecular chaperone HslO [Pelomicrobium sp.]
MIQRDILQPFVFERGGIRGELVRLDAAWRAATEGRRYPPSVRDLLGELMAASALLAATLKFNGSLVAQIQGDGKVPLLVVECTSELGVRGMAHWRDDVEAAPLGELVGDGRFVITLDPKDGRQSYQGIVELHGESVGAALEHYMQRSEQLATRLWLAADEQQAAGMLLQQLPAGAQSDEDAWDRVIALAATLGRDELLRLPPAELLRRLFHEEDVRVFDSRPVAFRCSCSAERVRAMLRMMGPDEVRSIVAERGEVEVHCEFCNRRYALDAVDAEQLFAASTVAEAGRTRH